MSIKTAIESLETCLALCYKGSLRDCSHCIVWRKREVGVTDLNRSMHQGNISSLDKQRKYISLYAQVEMWLIVMASYWLVLL